MNRVYKTVTDITAKLPGQIITAARFAMIGKDKKITIPSGRFLLHLESNDNFQVYRMTDGCIVITELQLDIPEVIEVIDEEIIIAMNSFKSLPEWMNEKGLDLDNYSHISPFNVIKCPICGGSNFTCQDFAKVYCACGCELSVRGTSGDPGFVVDCFPGFYVGDPVKYIVPPAFQNLYFYMVFKEEIFSQDGNTPIEVTDGSSDTIRAGVNKGEIFEVYPWRLAGVVPSSMESIGDATTYAIEGEPVRWPETATIPTLASNSNLIKTIDWAIYECESNKSSPDLVRELKKLKTQPKKSPFITNSTRPKICNLNDGEKYLLHHWSLITRGAGEPYAAIPIWYKVVVGVSSNYITGFKVIERNICPHCGNILTNEDWEELAMVKDENYYWHETENQHGGCLSTLRNIGWTFSQPVAEKA